MSEQSSLAVIQEMELNRLKKERDRLREALKKGVELEAGDLVGVEFKRKMYKWLKEARAALAEGGQDVRVYPE